MKIRITDKLEAICDAGNVEVSIVADAVVIPDVNEIMKLIEDLRIVVECWEAEHPFPPDDEEDEDAD